MTRRRVVITGLGLISPVGNTVAEGWANILAGRSGIDTITKFDASAFSCQFAGEVKGFNVEDYIPGKEARHMDTFIHYGMAAAIQAVQDAGMPTGDALDEAGAERIGCMVGSGIGGLPLIEQTARGVPASAARAAHLAVLRAGLDHQHDLGAHLHQIRLQGPQPGHRHGLHHRPALHRRGGPQDRVRRCRRDGGRRCRVHRVAAGHGWFRLGAGAVHAQRRPRHASRPWDKDRDGFVLGEGAGVLVLEEYEHAKRRGAKIYAELAGFGMGADAFHMTAPNVDGPKRSMRAALRNAGINADAVQYLNAHGTSTPLGDLNETNAIKLAFGDHAQRLVVNSTKSMTGHLLGGAGGIESVFTVLALHHQVSPPTINIFNQDPECDLDYCANTARDHEDRCRAEEQLRLRRHQRHAGLPARLSARAIAAHARAPRPVPSCRACGAGGGWRADHLAALPGRPLLVAWGCGRAACRVCARWQPAWRCRRCWSRRCWRAALRGRRLHGAGGAVCHRPGWICAGDGQAWAANARRAHRDCSWRLGAGAWWWRSISALDGRCCCRRKRAAPPHGWCVRVASAAARGGSGMPCALRWHARFAQGTGPRPGRGPCAMTIDDVDALLVERAKRGDQKAFEMLVVKYQRRIERLIARMVRDVDLVQDIAQETFIRAYRALPQFPRGQRVLHLAVPHRRQHRQEGAGRPEARPVGDGIGTRQHE